MEKKMLQLNNYQVRKSLFFSSFSFSFIFFLKWQVKGHDLSFFAMIPEHCFLSTHQFQWNCNLLIYQLRLSVSKRDFSELEVYSLKRLYLFTYYWFQRESSDTTISSIIFFSISSIIFFNLVDRKKWGFLTVKYLPVIWDRNFKFAFKIQDKLNLNIWWNLKYCFLMK